MNKTILKDLARECAAIAKANGFDETTEKNLPGKLMFVVDELCREAREAVYSGIFTGGAHSLEVELADGLIRLLSCMSDLYEDTWSVRDVCRDTLPYIFSSYEELVSQTVHYVCLAAECWRYGKFDDVQYSLEIAIAELLFVGQRLGIDLIKYARVKCNKNRSRGHLHGKKNSLG